MKLFQIENKKIRYELSLYKHVETSDDENDDGKNDNIDGVVPIGTLLQLRVKVKK